MYKYAPSRVGVLLFASGAFAWGPSAAAGTPDDCDPKAEDCVVVGHWNLGVALGAGVRTNPLVNGRDLPLVVVPQVSYYGRRFFLDNLDLGVSVAESASNTLSLIATPGYDRIFFYTSDLQNVFVNIGGAPNTGINGGVPSSKPFPPRSRPITYLAGPEWTFSLPRAYGQLDLLHEVTGHNHGNEIRAAVGIPWIQGRDTLKSSAGLTWQSRSIVDFYFGSPTIYEGGSVVRPFAKLEYSHTLGRGWRFSALAQYEHLGAAIADSPIVAKNYVVTMFVGAIYGR